MENLIEYKKGMDFTAKTFAGLEEVLADELKALGAMDVQIIKRGVQFRGDEALLFKANYCLRTAIRILKPISIFEAKDEAELYEKVKKIDWSRVFNVSQTFSVSANVFFSKLDHSHFVSLRVKDGIVDQFRDQTGKRPWVGKDNPDIYIDVHLNRDLCTISLDSSGESLHQRGYRIATDKAPINEVLAAGMIALTGWDGKKDFYDPMCGSGTIPLEAAMRASNIPAGYYRKTFAFMNWEGFDEKLWQAVKAEADAKMTEPDCRIFASDRSEKAVSIARRNLKNAGLHKDVELKVSYFDAVKPESPEGILVFNPPYGKRLEERGDIRDLYRGIGDVLKNNFQGFEAWIISSSFDSLKFIGLRPSRKIHLFNGPIETRFVKFEMYAGSKKGKYLEASGSKPETGKFREKKKEFRQKKDYKDYKPSEAKKPFRKSETDKPKPESEAKKQWYGRKPRLGKPEPPPFTGDGKSGTRKRRPRKS